MPEEIAAEALGDDAVEPTAQPSLEAESATDGPMPEPGPATGSDGGQ